jgi:NADH:ubiquinone oxidoreductase subunit 4 (subunit M)
MEGTLKTLILIPLIGTALVAIMPTRTEKEKEKLKNVGLITSILTFGESIRLWLSFDQQLPGFQYLVEFN